MGWGACGCGVSCVCGVPVCVRGALYVGGACVCGGVPMGAGCLWLWGAGGFGVRVGVGCLGCEVRMGVVCP